MTYIPLQSKWAFSGLDNSFEHYWVVGVGWGKVTFYLVVAFALRLDLERLPLLVQVHQLLLHVLEDPEN